MDKTEPPPRDAMASFRMPVMDKYKDMGCVVMGKSESGVVQARTLCYGCFVAN
jgi:peptide chain release factor subunit 3